ncbi:MAG: mandelate racemase/muconate lactonizing enzyme family protein [Acidimicrobiia bacterium]|nr:mandelate racemase/muconate lactonizing enzyme family protein [Acidimicrobiia bacterium]
MKITRISVYQLDVRLLDGGYRFAKGRLVEVADTTVVRIDTDEGLVGWGETTPLGPSYLPSYGPGVRTGTAHLAPHLLGLDPTLLGPINVVMDRELQGHSYAKSAIDVACWDILGKATGQPVHALLGGRMHESLPMYGSVSQGDPAWMAERATRFRQDGYEQIQVKVGDDPTDDVARLRAVTRDSPPSETVLADANRGWRRDEALRFALATTDLGFILEQPCDRYADNLSVRGRVPQRFKLDESLQGMDDVTVALADDAMDVACIKISKFGGLTKSRLARDVCAAAGIPMTVEDVWGCQIVTAAVGHLAISTPPVGFLNTTDLQSYNDIVLGEPSAYAVGGRLVVTDDPGLGIDPDPAVLGEPVAVFTA